MSRIEFRVLGPVEVVLDGAAVRIGSPTQRTLLALLLMQPNELLSTDRIVDALWRDNPAEGRRKLWFHVSKLRGILQRRGLQGVADELLVTRPTGYVLRIDADRLDASRFERLVSSARSVREENPARAAELLRQALALWHGKPFEDVLHEDSVSSEAARLNALRVAALEERVEADLALGGGGELVSELEALVAAHPFREHLRAQLMLALYRAGRQADALTAYGDARRTLVEELGVEPTEGLKELQRHILVHDPALDRPRRGETPVPVASAASVAAEARIPREERKVVTVLFADLVDFTATAERLDPEDVRAFLTPYYAHIRSELERFGGRVEKFIGDAVIALFGAALAHEDDPERAVRAALALRKWVADQGGPQQVRIGIETGEAHVTLDARASQAEPVAVGEVVNTAARLQAAAPINGVLVGPRTFRATRHAVEYRGLQPIAAKGTSQPLRLWEAVRSLAQPGVDPARHRSPFVGRERDLAALRDRLAWAASDRSPQLVTILGVPGIGKTRLLSELQQAAARADEPVTWRQGRSLPYGDGVSFWALGEMVKGEAEILESDPAENALRKLANAVERVVDDPVEAQRVTTSLSVLVGLGAGETADGGGRAETFAAWRGFIEALADARPLVLVFEDLHWADEGLLDFVDELVDRVSRVRLLVLVTARPELLRRRSGWGGGKPNAVTISLPPLSDSETAHLVAALLGQSVAQAEAQETLLARVGGNPLYAEQFCRMMLERGGLDELPETVQGIIAARLDGLADEQKRLLQDAAVIGKVFWAGALEAIAGVSRGRAEELLYQLERSEFVTRARRSSVAGNTEYAFRHDLLREVAYGQIPRAGRGEAHRLTAQWIESLAHPEDHAELLAHHHVAALEYAHAAGEDVAGLVKPAVLALHHAGLRAIRLSANDRAVEYLSRAIDLVEQLEQADERSRMEADLQMQLGIALWAVRGASAPEVERAHARAIDLMIAGGPVAEDFPALFGLCFVHTVRGNFDRSTRLVEQMKELASQGDEAMRLQSLHSSWANALLSGRIDEAVATADEGLSIYRPEAHHALSFQYGNHDPGVCALTFRAVATALRGESVSAVAQLREAIDLSETLGHPISRVHPLSWLTVVLHINGDVDGVLVESERALAATGELVYPMLSGMVRAMRVWAVSYRARYEEGIAELEGALADQLNMANNTIAVLIGTVLAEVHLRLGRREAARAVLDDARALADSMRTYFYESELLRVEAEWFRLEGSEADARRLFLRAIETAREHGSWALAVRAAVQLVRTSEVERDADLKLLVDLCDRLPPENDTEYRREANDVLARTFTTS
jgi:DNA-binding SARP family transcriptional activator/tetratricopeptide (TPR) repeat protein